MLWMLASAIILMGALATGVAATAALGWTGERGEFTARECHMERGTKGGWTRVCAGTFVPESGTWTDEHAGLHWPDGRAGERLEVQSLVIGGYTEVGSDTVAMLLTLCLTLTTVTSLSAYAALSPRSKRRLVSVMPRRFQHWYVREWTMS
ncbi:hypothetical protein [Streptomyces meridianus]|uniref:Uncharacterized protein n=1 Tax=Streptomyces meridianus TaxID=2938945 RepID=A0ABT0X4V9_9ACTN|nr:hypothetical protein [Streptomyces meridianus]MCM2577576.1 hypothetical protein [Streptomyces meridianus]